MKNLIISFKKILLEIFMFISLPCDSMSDEMRNEFYKNRRALERNIIKKLKLPMPKRLKYKRKSRAI